MLEAWIIDQIRKHEQAEPGAEERARIEIDAPVPATSKTPPVTPSEDSSERGVTVIDI